MTQLGTAFLTSARHRFSDRFSRLRFVEVGSHDDLNFASLTLRNDSHYLRLSCDFRDRFVTASFGPLVEGVVPPVPIAPARDKDHVQEIPSGVLLWSVTGNKASSFGLGRYEHETAVDIDRAVGRVADALASDGAERLSGDYRAWTRAAELSV